tara:strand:- start:166 stop:1164 length:999 start_codon:yes stop_codon:yes gene_type:complete
MFNKKLAIVGASGAVGRVFLELLDEKYPGKKDLYLVASKRSAGNIMSCGDEEFVIQDIENFNFSNIDIAFFSAGAKIAEKYAPLAVSLGCTVIDNSSYFRTHEDKLLIVPEVNSKDLCNFESPGIISNPNCSTAQLVVALKPIHDLFLIKRVDVASYQSVSGTGKEGIDELIEQTKKLLNDEEIHPKVYGAQIAFNVIPAGDILENNYTNEEIKMSFETNKILDKDIKLSATCSRVPVLYGHSLAVHVETEKEINLDLLIQKIKDQKGLDFFDSQDFISPNAVNHAEGKNPVSIGRVRLDLWDKNRVNFWVVADNLRKGAALNSLQILDELL